MFPCTAGHVSDMENIGRFFTRPLRPLLLRFARNDHYNSSLRCTFTPRLSGRGEKCKKAPLKLRRKEIKRTLISHHGPRKMRVWPKYVVKFLLVGPFCQPFRLVSSIPLPVFGRCPNLRSISLSGYYA